MAKKKNLSIYQAAEKAVKANSVSITVKELKKYVNKRKPKKTSVKRIKSPKTRNAGKWTEGQFWSFIRAVLRNKSRWWIPRLNALKNARRSNQSVNRRLKWEFQCKTCKNWYPQKNMEVHHTIEAGSLKSAQDLPGFVERLFAETGWVCLCKTCHKKEHE